MQQLDMVQVRLLVIAHLSYVLPVATAGLTWAHLLAMVDPAYVQQLATVDLP